MTGRVLQGREGHLRLEAVAEALGGLPRSEDE